MVATTAYFCERYVALAVIAVHINWEMLSWGYTGLGEWQNSCFNCTVANCGIWVHVGLISPEWMCSVGWMVQLSQDPSITTSRASVSLAVTQITFTPLWGKCYDGCHSYRPCYVIIFQPLVLGLSFLENVHRRMKCMEQGDLVCVISGKENSLQ